MWLWTRLFGTSSVAVRLPFMLMGIASVPLIYGVGRRWYGRWSALLPAAIIAVSQYTVYYSDIARPYCAGLFFVLCALYVLTRMVSEHSYSVWRLILFADFEACCAYTHYFCSLTTFLLACAAIFLVDRRHRLPYLAACLGSVVLFAPHLPITLYQLTELKGVGGWLGVPKPSFGLEYIRYLNHHSLLVAIVCLVGFAVLFNPATARKNVRLLVTSLCLGLLPPIIGYIYSVAVNPVLQFSVLIFSFPFLLLALAACVNNMRHVWHTAVISALVATMVVTLFTTRRHYTMLGKEWIEASVREAELAASEYGNDNVACLFNISPRMVAYYDSTLCLLPQDAFLDAASLDSTLSQCRQPWLVCSGIQDPATLAIVNQHYPVLMRAQSCVVSEVCLFGRHPSPDALCADKLASIVIERPLRMSANEFNNILDTILDDVADSRFLVVESRVQFYDTATDEVYEPVYLVTELVDGRHKLDWRSETLTSSTDSLATVVLPVRVESTVKHRARLKHTRLKIYLWNPSGNTSTIPVDCRIRLFPTSPWMYSVLEEI